MIIDKSLHIGDDTVVILGDDRNDDVYLAVPPDFGADPYGSILTVIRGRQYRVYRANYLMCPVCNMKKWFANYNGEVAVEQVCRCQDPDGLPSMTDRLNWAMKMASVCKGCGAIGSVSKEADTLNVHYTMKHTAHCNTADVMPPNLSYTDVTMYALLLIREDFSRRLVDANSGGLADRPPAGAP